MEKALLNSEGEVAALNRRVASLEEDLEKSEERLLTATQKLDLVATAGDDSQRMCKVLEEHYKEQIKHLTAKLKQAEARAEFAERSVQKLQKEVDRLEDELVHEKEKFKAVSDELDQTFAEMSGY